MKTRIMRLLLPVLWMVLLSVSLNGRGQTPFTATYTFGANGNVQSFAYNGTTYDGISMSNIVKVGVTTSSSSGNFRANSWPTSESVDDGKYIGFSITAADGYKFTVNTINFGIGRSSTGIRNTVWRGSNDSYAELINNYTTLNAGLTNNSGVLNNPDENSSWTGNVLTLTGYSDITTSCGFRMYMFSAEASTGTAGLQGPITISGTFETTSVTPTISVSHTSLTGFTYVLGSGPSAEQSFNVSGTNLTADISITPSANYEISTGTGGSFVATNPIILEETAGTVASTPIYVRLKAGLTAGDYNGENITASSTGADSKTVACSGSVTDPILEPTNHPTGFGAVANSSSAITVSWTDAVPAADGYLIKGSSVGYGDIVSPVDGTAESNGTLIRNVAGGVGTYQFTGLTSSTQYFFKIFPYNGSGATINYKTDGSVPEATATTQAIIITTYTWIGADNASWTDASNWNPNRSTPESTDILQFNDGAAKTVTSVPAQTIGKLLVTGNTTITLQAGSSGTLTIAGGVDDDLVIGAGSQLNISGATALILSLSTGATGSISGSVTLSGAAHRLLAADASGITFNSGASFTSGTSFSGNPFGNTTSGSVIFASGSTFIFTAGSNPFAISPSVTIFETGSLYKHQSTNTPSFSGRTYANFEFDFNNTVSATGSSAVSIDNLKITQGTFNFNVTGTPGHSIKGNIEVSNGAILNFTPSSAGTVNINGSSAQSIYGGGMISSGVNSTIVVSNASGVSFNNNATLNNLTIATDCELSVSNNISLTVSGTLTNNAGSTGLIIESDASGTGSLIHNTNNVPATVQRYITGSANLLSRYYHHVSIPLNSNVLSSQFNGSYLFSFNQGTQTWNQITEDDVTLSNNQGYMIFYPNSNTTYNFVGQLNNGAFVASTTTDAIDEYSLVPNPYPSAIDWDAASGWTKTNLQDAIWIWNPVSQNYASYITGAGTNGGSRYIATGQAFFVKSSAASPVLSMDNNVRLHNAQAFFNTPINNQMLRVRAEANGFSDEAIVRFHADASLNFEMNLDVDKLRGNEVAPQLYTLSADARELSISSVPFAFENFIMPLNFESASEGEITFIFSELNTFEQGASMFLEDKTTGEMINIQEQQSYSFSHAASNDPDRFNLHFFGVTGVDDVVAKGSYQIWSSDRKVYVNIPELNGQRASIEMFDVLGSRIFSSEGVMNSPAVVRAANSGVAIVRVTAQGRVYTTKLFIQ